MCRMTSYYGALMWLGVVGRRGCWLPVGLPALANREKPSRLADSRGQETAGLAFTRFPGM